MTDEDVIRRIKEIARCGCVTAEGPRKDHWKPVWFFTVKGTPAVELMCKIRPYMGKRRLRQIDAAVSSLMVTRRLRLKDEEVREIRGLLALGLSDREVGRRVRRAHTCVAKIRRGQTYKNVA